MSILRKIYLLLVCTLIHLISVQAQNPERKQLPHEVPSPERVATKITDEMNKELLLTEKQYDKLYKLNLKEQKLFFANASNNTSGLGMDRHSPMGERSGFKDDREHSQDNDNGGMEPGMRKNHFPANGNFNNLHSLNQDNAEKLKKAAETKEKKIKKILTEEQYVKWQEFQKTKHPSKPEHVFLNTSDIK